MLTNAGPRLHFDLPHLHPNFNFFHLFLATFLRYVHMYIVMQILIIDLCRLIWVYTVNDVMFNIWVSFTKNPQEGAPFVPGPPGYCTARSL